MADCLISPCNHARTPNPLSKRRRAQKNFESARDKIRKIAVETYDNTTLFQRPAKPVTIAVPAKGEGLSVDRANLAPGLITVDKGKFLAKETAIHSSLVVSGSLREWRSLCIVTMQHSLWAAACIQLTGVRDLISGDYLGTPSDLQIRMVSNTHILTTNQGRNPNKSNNLNRNTLTVCESSHPQSSHGCGQPKYKITQEK